MANEALIHAPSGAKSLSPLPSAVHHGLSAVTSFAILSLISTALLFLHLLYRLVFWSRTTQARFNQYLFLLLNLIFADLIQSLAFTLNVIWLAYDGILADSASCVAQGWLINAGDVSSCAFTLAMAFHLFAGIIFDYRPSKGSFVFSLICLWVFAFFVSSIGLIVHPEGFYMRAGMWCWISEAYMPDRVWLHYFWILLTESAVVVLYTAMFVILRRRIKDFFYISSSHRMRAESAARTIIIYPIVYVVCTLPAVVVRLRIMTGHTANYATLGVLGVMLTSNGWLDVLVYALTRRALLFGRHEKFGDEDVYGLETFPTWESHHPEETRDQLTGLSVMHISHDWKGAEVQQRELDEKDSISHMSSRDSYPTLPPVVEYYDRQGMSAPAHVRIVRSEGDLRKPGMRFPRRRDPAKIVRDEPADMGKEMDLKSAKASGESSTTERFDEKWRHDSVQPDPAADQDSRHKGGQASRRSQRSEQEKDESSHA